MEIVDQRRQLPLIKTKRLCLRAVQLDDISDDYIEWLNDPATNRFLEIRFVPQTRETVREYIQSKLADTHNTKHFGVFDHDGARLIGNVTAQQVNWHHRHADISFIIGHREAQGRGYATEAVHALSYYLFRECGLQRLCGGFYSSNVKSARIFERNGYSVEGRLRKHIINDRGEREDTILVGLLAEDFVPSANWLGELPSSGRSTR